MGCCFSINTPNSKKDQNALKTHQTHEEVENRAPPPPPPPVEEESVKEVLSETPISKPQVSILMEETKTQLPESKTQYAKGPLFHEAEELVSEEVSQITTETCSVSESFTTTIATATTVTENGDDEATSKRSTREGTQNRYRSQSKRSSAVDGNRIGGRERRPRSPAYPPEKRIPAISRSVRRREYQVRRGPDEGSGRRSRSPSASRRVSGGNDRLSQVKPPAIDGRRLPPVNGVSERVVEENDVVPREESLENPHVSLECFIFL